MLSLTLILNTARPAAALTSADVVYYGTYPQTKNVSGDFPAEPIAWRVLEVSGDKGFLLSEKVLDCMYFNKVPTSRPSQYWLWWSESPIRKFLNGKKYRPSVSADITGHVVENPKDYSFYERAFVSGEQNCILEENLDNSATLFSNDIPAGPNTDDRIFLLSVAELQDKRYGFNSGENDDPTRDAQQTAYCDKNGTLNGYWWTRSIANDLSQYEVVNVYPEGLLAGNAIYNWILGIRPAFYLNMKNVIFTSPANGGKAGGVTSVLLKQNYTSDDKGRCEQKLTIAADKYKLESAALTTGAVAPGTDIKLSIEYAGASTGPEYHLAAVVTEGDRAVYYGKIKSLASAADRDGSASFTIPEFREGDSLHVLVEGRNNNHNYMTDFASMPKLLAGTGTGRPQEALSEDVVEEPAPKTTAIDVNPSALTIVKGYAAQLSVIFVPEGASEKIIWSSDKPDIAAVDSSTGVVKALGAGTAVITASTPGGKTSSCAVTVTEKTQAEGIVLTPASMTMHKGTKEKITVSFNGIAEQPLVWSSSDEKIAKVDGQGNVTTLSEGKCMIKVSTADGAASAECAVKVTPDSGGGSGGGSGGCNAGLGLGALALLTLLPCAVRKNKGGK